MSFTNSLFLIEGPSGSGKTTLAAQLQQHLTAQLGTDVAVLHLEDLYLGWGGLAEGAARAVELVEQRAAGQTLRWQSYNWATAQLDEWHELAPEHPLIVEGCGALNAASASHAEVRIWLDAPVEIRQQRAFSRGGEDYEQHWNQWDEQYAAYVATHRPRAFANMTRVATQ